VIGNEERALRRQLTDFYHLVDHLGWSEMIFNHISVRVPGDTDQYLVNPYGLTYDEITPENLIKVDVDGNIVGQSNYDANPAGFAPHSAIHAHRRDVNCVAHVHTIAISAVANKADGFSHDNFYGAQLTGRIAYHEFEGVTLETDEKERMLASLGDRDILVLRNHGIAICGPDVASTFYWLWFSQRAALIQTLGQAMQGPDNVIPDDVRERCVHDASRMTSVGTAAYLTYEAAVRRMRRDQARMGGPVLLTV
jgi:ribulose-5-phosphate 4-epimerase/fuculose-1-phosphate aldolase